MKSKGCKLPNQAFITWWEHMSQPFVGGARITGGGELPSRTPAVLGKLLLWPLIPGHSRILIPCVWPSWKGCGLSWQRVSSGWEVAKSRSNSDHDSTASFQSSLVVQPVQDPALSLLQLGSLLWCRLDSWPRNFCMPRAWPKSKTKTKPRFFL